MGFQNSVPPGFMPPDNGPLPGFGGGTPGAGSPFPANPGFVPVEVVPEAGYGKPLPQVPFGPAPPVTPFGPYPQQPTYQPTKSSGGCLATIAGTIAVLMLSCLGGSIVIAKVAHRMQRENQRQREFEVGPAYPLLPDRSGIDDMREISERMNRESEERMEEMRRWSEDNHRRMQEDLDRLRYPPSNF